MNIIKVLKGIFIIVFFLSLSSCDTSVNEKSTGNNKTSKVQNNNDFWSNSNRKHLKIDSTEFEVIATKNSLEIILEKK